MRTAITAQPESTRSFTPPLIQRKCACGNSASVTGQCSECQGKKLLQRRANDQGAISEVPPIVHEVLRSPGQSLEPATRTFMESRFAQDFSQVKIHTDEKAQRSAKAVNALAYTVGKNIVFGTGQYEPQTESGKQLLAHELTHVQQQGQQPVLPNVPLTIASANSPLEQAAETNSSQRILQSPKRSLHSPSNILLRQLRYIEQVTGAEAQPFLERFDRSVQNLETVVRGSTGSEATDLLEAVASLRRLREQGLVTCWRTSGGLYYASYDSATGQLRLHINHGEATNPSTLLHEAIHAVHASRYPRLSRMYGDALAAGGTRDEALGILFLKWKAWTEYWAYRRTVEYDNLRQVDPTFRRDAHQEAMQTRDVRVSIARVREATGQDFDPQSWSPPRRYRARSR